MLKLLDFSAEWCPPCQAMKPIVSQIKQEMADQVEVEVIDIETDQERVREFEIMGVPTFVLMKDGEEVGRRSGQVAKSELQSWIETQLD